MGYENQAKMCPRFHFPRVRLPFCCRKILFCVKVSVSCCPCWMFIDDHSQKLCKEYRAYLWFHTGAVRRTGRLRNNCFLTLLFPLFPYIPTLSVVKHMVKEPFLTRRGKPVAACPEGLFFMFRFWDCISRKSERKVFSHQAYQILLCNRQMIHPLNVKSN